LIHSDEKASIFLILFIPVPLPLPLPLPPRLLLRPPKS